MYALVAVKFRDATLHKWLLDTQQPELKEWVKSGELYWTALSYSGQTGQNMLGHILMEVREFIRQNPPRNCRERTTSRSYDRAKCNGDNDQTSHATSAVQRSR